MNSIKSAFTLLLFAGMSTSCQKEFDLSDPADGNPSHSVSFKVRTYTEDITFSSQHRISTFNLSYDSSDRITSMASASAPGDKFVYQYSNNSFTVDIYNESKLSIHSVYFINNLGVIDSSIQYNETQDTMTEKYEYTAEKRLLKLKVYDYLAENGARLIDSHDYTYDSRGNVLKDSSSNITLTYDYYQDMFNNLFLGQVYPHRNKNLVKTTTYRDSGVTETVNHTYTFDNYNRITSEKIVATTGHISVKSYTY